MELYEIKNFCTTKEMISKLKRPPTEWKNIFASYTSDKGLITRIYRELKKLNSTQKKNDPIQKWATDQRKMSKWPKAHEKMLTIPGKKEMQIKTTLRFCLTPVRIAIIKNTTNKKC
jgi:hypothetical protein